MKNFAPKTSIKHNWLNGVDNKLHGILDNFFIRSEAAQSKDGTSTKITKNGEGSITSGDIAHREDNELFFFDLSGNRKGGTSTQLQLSQNSSEQIRFTDKDTIVDMADSDIEITYSGKNKKDKGGNFNRKKKKKINSNSTTDSVWDNDFVAQKKNKKLSKATSATLSDSLLSHRKDSELFFFNVSGKKINNSLTQNGAAEHTHFNDMVVDMVDSDLELTYSGSCKKKKRISLENGSMEKNEDSGYKKKKIKYNHIEEESSSQKMEKKLERENNKKSSKNKKKQESIDSNTTILNSSLEIVENDTPKKKNKRKNKNLDKEDTIKDLQVLFTSKKMKDKHKSKTLESNTKLIDLKYEKELELSSGNISKDFTQITTRKKKKKKCQNEDTHTENNEEKHPSQTPDLIEDTHLTCEKVNKKKKKEKAKEISPEKDSNIQIHNSSIKIVDPETPEKKKIKSPIEKENTSTGNSKKSKKDKNTSLNNSNPQNRDSTVFKKSKENTYISSDHNFDDVIDNIIEGRREELKRKCKDNEIHEIDNLNEDTTKIVECDSESISQYQSFNDLQNTGTGNSKKSKKDQNTSLNNSNPQNSDNTVFKKSKKKERTYTSSDYNFDTVIDSIIESTSDELKKKSKDNEEIHEIDNLNKDATKIVECDSESISQYQSFNDLQNTGTGTIIKDSKMGKNSASQDLFDSNDEREDTIDNIKAFLKADLKHRISQQKIIEETKDSGFEDSDNITKTKKNTEDIVIEKQKKKKYNEEIQTIDKETSRSIKDLLDVIKDRNRKINSENNLKRKKSSSQETSDSDQEFKIEKKKRTKRSKSNNQSFHISPGDVDQCSDSHESINRTKLNVDEIFSDDENHSKEIERRKFRGRRNSSYTGHNNDDGDLENNSSSDKDISMDSRRNSSYSESENNDYKPTDQELEVLRNIEIRIPFDIPVLHMINRPSKPTLEDVKNAKILNAKFGAFSKQEDATIVQNWQQFCESHNLSLRPIVFFRFHRCCSTNEKIKFLQYISHGLNDRMPFRVHFRFKKLFEDKQLKYGRYTAEEDKEIVEFINTTKSLKPFRDLGLLLNRGPHSLEQRYAKLTSKKNKSYIKWDLLMAERMIKAIMEIVKTDNIKNLKHVILDDAQWKEVSKILDNIPTKKLQRAWKINIHSKLFMKESTSDVKEDLVYMMIKNKENDFRTISWENYAKNFRGITSIKLQDIFRSMMAPLPKKYKNNLKSVLEFLSTHLETRKRSRIQCRYKFKGGHLTCKRIKNKET